MVDGGWWMWMWEELGCREQDVGHDLAPGKWHSYGLGQGHQRLIKTLRCHNTDGHTHQGAAGGASNEAGKGTAGHAVGIAPAAAKGKTAIDSR